MNYNNKVLIIGCGAITSSFHLPALIKLIPRNHIFLYDKNSEISKNLGKNFNIDNVVIDVEKSFQNIDSAILAVPHQFSFDIAKKLLSNGINVLGEKPLTSSVQELDELIEIADKKKLVFCGNHTRRFFPSIVKLKKLLSQENIKEINIYEGDPFSWKSKSGFYFEGGKGVLIDRGPHIINVVNFLTNHEDLTPIEFSHNSSNYSLPESHCKIRLNSNSFKVNIIISWIYKLSNQIEIITENKRFTVGISSFNFLNQYHNDKVKNITAKPIKTQFDQFSDDVADEFLRHVNSGKSNSILANDVRQSVKLIEKLYKMGNKFNER